MLLPLTRGGGICCYSNNNYIAVAKVLVDSQHPSKKVLTMEIMQEYEQVLMNMQYDFERSKLEYEVTDSFPPKPHSKYCNLFDCRLQLLLYEDVTIESGETKKLATTCIITPNNGWVLSTKPNPALGLILQEEYIKPSLLKFRLEVTVINITMERKSLPRGVCVAYLLMK